ncbi:hypothetical protein F4804DRAFT_270792 [Jackrogersella minutella]|nr:hypothetical protein F4804DRAFT_270792 [Jackrogersella minutella]
MATKKSRQRRREFCERARRRDTPFRTFFAGRANRKRHYQGDSDAMPSTTTFNTKYFMNHNHNKYERPSQSTIRPQPLAPARIFDQTTITYPPARPASRAEIYGLALGTCCLVLLIGWLLVMSIRNSVNILINKPSRINRKMVSQNDDLTQGQARESQSFLSNLRQVSAEELIKSAQRRSADVATGLKRDMSELRRMAHPTRRRMDEEAALGGTEEGGGESNGPFLRKTCQTEDALSA